jgi:hypothetical protein
VIRHSLIGIVALALMYSSSIGAQQQSSSSRTGWPCGGRLDPAYFDVAEATGGQLLLLAPGELGGAAPMLIAFNEHRQTIFRLAGTIKPGVHEFRVPIDASVESVVFSISVQCLQTAEITSPSGAPAGGEGVTDLSNFIAQRMVIVPRPAPGVWTIRASGRGVAGVTVQARSALGLAEAEFAAGDGAEFTSVPVPGVESIVRIGLSAPAGQIQASLVNAAFRRIAPLKLTPGRTENTFVSRFTPPADAFRVMVEGKDANGLPFQRVHAPLMGGKK